MHLLLEYGNLAFSVQITNYYHSAKQMKSFQKNQSLHTHTHARAHLLFHKTSLTTVTFKQIVILNPSVNGKHLSLRQRIWDLLKYLWFL